MKKLIILTTDGSSLIENKKYESSSACSIHINGSHVCSLGMYHDNGTNSFGELYAIVLGLDRIAEIICENPELREDSAILVLSDSEYVVKSLNEYIYSWVKQGMSSEWKTSKGEKVAYQSTFKYLWNEYRSGDIYIVEDVPVKICHMRGHIGEKVNIATAYTKFIKKNNLPITFETFNKFISHNHDVDTLANDIRLRKDVYYEERGDSVWVKRRKKLSTRKGKVVILPRNRRNA